MVEINFNDLPCDIKDLIFGNNRKWVNDEIKKYKNMFQHVMYEIDNFKNVVNEISGEDILKRIKHDMYQQSVPFCTACECVDGCGNNYCYYNFTYNFNDSDKTKTRKLKKLKKYYPQHLVDWWIEDKTPDDMKIKYKLPKKTSKDEYAFIDSSDDE